MLPCLLLLAAPASDEIDVFDIFNEQESTVVSAARHEQAQAEAPSATTIISAEEIRRAGELLFADLLRRYAGMDVTQITPNEYSVGIRGDLHAYKNDKVLVLIDGRPFHVEGFGSVNWQTLLNYLEDIERIEIVRGPGSTLYGANAFSGTINIVLKRPIALPLFETTISGGFYSADIHTTPRYRPAPSYRGHLGHALHKGPVSYRLFLDYMTVSSSEGFGYGINNGNLGAEMDADLGEARQLRLVTMFTGGGRQDSYSVAETTERAAVANFDSYSSLDYNDRHFSGRASYRYTGDLNFNSVQNRGAVQSVQGEFGYSSSELARQTLSVGADARYNMLRWIEIDPGIRDNVHASVYALDDIRAADFVTVSLGVRGEVSKYPGIAPFFLVSPRAAAVFRVSDQNTFRLGVARGMRAPSALDLFALPDAPRLLPGNPDLRPEDAWNVDLGWSFKYERVRGAITPFVTAYNGLRRAEVFTLQNSLDLLALGGEAELTWSVNTFFRVSLNYSNQNWWRRDTWQSYAAGPRHKLNAMFDIDLPFGLEANLAIGWVDTSISYDRTPDSAPYVTRVAVGARTFIDAKMLYPLPRGFNIFVAAQNLNHLLSPAFESPAGLAAPIGGRVLLGASVRVD